MRGTRTALDLESEDMEEIALHVEEVERYGTAEEFYHPDVDSEVSSMGYEIDLMEGPIEQDDTPSDENENTIEAEAKEAVEVAAEENEATQDIEVVAEESIFEGGPVGVFSIPDPAEDQTAISTLGCPSLIQPYQTHYHPPERSLVLAPKRTVSIALTPEPEKKEEVTRAIVKFNVPDKPVKGEDEDEENPNLQIQNVEPGTDSGFRGLLCNQPCGKLEIAAVLLSLTAFVLTGTATDRCDFLKLENDRVPTFWDLPERTVGLLQFETLSGDTVTTQCLYWFDYPDAAELLYDGTWHAARFMSVAATFLGLVFVGFISTFSCISYKAEVFQRLSFAALTIPLLYGLSFVSFGSDACLQGTCEIGIGGLLMVMGVIVWLLLSAVLYMIPGARTTTVAEPKQLIVGTAKRNAYLGLAMLAVMVIIAVVNLSVIFGRVAPGVPDDFSPGSADAQDENKDWLQAGETTQGPYPDAHDYLALSGDAKVMSVIGKESVLTLEFDVKRKLWYPFGNMIAANLDPVGWDTGDRVTKFRASAASLSENGQVISVGSSNWASAKDGGDEYEFGKVQTWKYHLESQRWIPKGHPLTGKAKGDSFASKVKLSRDGKRLAVLADGLFGKHQPYVRVYQYDDVYEKNGNWVQLGGDIMLESFWTASGFAFSGDGSSLVLGSLRIGRLGLVTVWHYDEDTKTWNRRGSPISSGSSSRDDQFGEAVAISGNGSILAVGDPGGFPSYARAFWLDGGEWTQLGQDLECKLDDGRCAHDLAMSKFGTTIAITEYSYQQMARVYTLDILEEEWVQVGEDIEMAKSGESAEGTTIELSSDGRSVAFGITFQDTQTQVWKYRGELSFGGQLERDVASPGPSQAPAGATVSASAPVFIKNPTASPTLSPTAISVPELIPSLPAPILNLTLTSTNDDNATLPSLSMNETESTTTTPMAISNATVADLPSGIAAAAAQNETGQPWVSNVMLDDIAYFLFESRPRVERYDMAARAFLPTIPLPTTHGTASALGIDSQNQMYVGYGTSVFRYSLNGTDETSIAANAKTKVIGFHFDGDLVFINAGQYFISVDGMTNTLIKQFFSFNEMEFGTSITKRHKRIFGRTPDEVAALSGDIIRRSDLWFKEYNEEGDFVSEKLARLDQKVDLESASKTWMFPDQTRLVDDKGYVFSVASAEYVYSLDTPGIRDIAWLGGEVMIVLHKDGSLSGVSQELRVTGTATLDTEMTPACVAISNGEVYAFSHDPNALNEIRVDQIYLGHLKPALPGRPINPTNVPFIPEFPFVDNHGLLYMLSKGHSSIFVLEPESMQYKESIKLEQIPRYVAYSGANNEIYTLRENRVLSKIDLASENTTEVAIATSPSAPLGLSTAGEFIFVCDDSGAFTTHYTFLNNGTMVSSVDWNHYDEEFVWSDANRKMYFFRQADPTDLMTEHIFENGTIGNRVDSFLNNNSGFEHPIRVDQSGHHALLGSGIIHNAKSLKRMNRTLSNSIVDAAFGKGFVHTIRNVGNDMVELQQWHSHSFEPEKAQEVVGRAHCILSLGNNRTVALITNATNFPHAYVLDSQLNVL